MQNDETRDGVSRYGWMRMLAVAVLVTAAGCAQSSSSSWAQGSRVLTPTYPASHTVNLSVRKDADEVVETSADRTVD